MPRKIVPRYIRVSIWVKNLSVKYSTFLWTSAMSSRKKLWQILESRYWEILSEEKSKVRILHCFWSPHFDQFASIGHIHSCGPPPILNWVSHITFRARLWPRGNICQICGNHPQIQISNILKKYHTWIMAWKVKLPINTFSLDTTKEIFGTRFKGKEGSG